MMIYVRLGWVDGGVVEWWVAAEDGRSMGWDLPAGEPEHAHRD